MLSVVDAVRTAGVLWQHHDEFIPFCEWLQTRGVTSVLEIGTGFGGSAFVFGELTGHGRVVTVDFDRLMTDDRRRAQPNPRFVQVHGDSRTDVVESEIATYAPFDLVYFDTEHPYENCVDNMQRYGKMASRFIAQHDINMDEMNWPDAGIPKFWREVSAGRSIVTFVHPAHDPRFPRWGGLGVICL